MLIIDFGRTTHMNCPSIHHTNIIFDQSFMNFVTMFSTEMSSSSSMMVHIAPCIHELLPFAHETMPFLMESGL